MFFDSRRSWSGGEGQDSRPSPLDGRDPLEFLQLNRRLVVQGHVWAKEVVVGHEESGERDSAVCAVKTSCGPYVVFEGSI